MAGDALAYERLMAHFAKRILTFTRNFVFDENETEDAAHEVVIAVWQSIGKIQSPYAFTTWLQRLMFHVVKDYNKKHMRHTRNRGDFEAEESVTEWRQSDSPDEALFENDDRQALHGFIKRLTDVQRQSLYLHYYEEMSYAEIAELTKVSTQTVGSNIHKAKANLKKMFEQERIKEYLKEHAADIGDKKLEAMIVGFFVADSNHFATAQVVNSLCAYTHGMAKSAVLVHSVAGKTGANVAGKAGANIGAKAGASAAGKAAGISKAVLLAKPVIAICVGAGATTLVAANVAGVGPFQHTADVPSPGATITEHVVYAAEDASILFEGAQAGTPNVNPSAASVVLLPENPDVIVTGWSILTQGGAEVVSGAGAYAEIPELPEGQYSVKFSLTKRGVATAAISRVFHIAEPPAPSDITPQSTSAPDITDEPAPTDIADE